MDNIRPLSENDLILDFLHPSQMERFRDFIYFQVRALVVVHLSSRLCIVHRASLSFPNASYNNLQRRRRRSRPNVVLALPMDTF